MKIIPYDALLKGDLQRVLDTAPSFVSDDISSLFNDFPSNGFIAYVLGTPVAAVCSDAKNGNVRASFSLFVSPEHRKNGIGSALLDVVLENVKKYGISRLFCDFSHDAICERFAVFHGFTYKFSSLFMSFDGETPEESDGFEQYDDSMFSEFAAARALAFYPMRVKLGTEPALMPPNENLRSYLREHASTYFVLRENGEIIAGGGLNGDEIDDVFVDNAHRGRGIARRLIGKCINVARRRGEKQVVLWVISVNERAEKLYRSMGFYEERRHDFYEAVLL